MSNQIFNLSIQIFPYIYPGSQAIFALDNTSNYSYFAENLLLAG